MHRPSLLACCHHGNNRPFNYCRAAQIAEHSGTGYSCRFDWWDPNGCQGVPCLAKLAHPSQQPICGPAHMMHGACKHTDGSLRVLLLSVHIRRGVGREEVKVGQHKQATVAVVVLMGQVLHPAGRQGRYLITMIQKLHSGHKTGQAAASSIVGQLRGETSTQATACRFVAGRPEHTASTA